MRHFGAPLLAALALTTWTGVAPPAILTVEGGDVSLSINSATAGQNPDPAVDQTTSDLKYRVETGDSTMKITVATDLASPLFTLKVEATGVGDGNPTGEVVVATTAQDLITDITTEAFQLCDLRYTSVALASDGTGTDAHTITYTIVAQ